MRSKAFSLFCSLLLLISCSKPNKQASYKIDWNTVSADTTVVLKTDSLRISLKDAGEQLCFQLRIELLQASSTFPGLRYLVEKINKDLLKNFYLREFDNCLCAEEKISKRLQYESYRYKSNIKEYADMLERNKIQAPLNDLSSVRKHIKDTLLYAKSDGFISILRLVETQEGKTLHLIPETYNYYALNSQKLTLDSLIDKDKFHQLILLISEEATRLFQDTTNFLSLTQVEEMGELFLGQRFYISKDGIGFVFESLEDKPRPVFVLLPTHAIAPFLREGVYKDSILSHCNNSHDGRA